MKSASCANFVSMMNAVLAFNIQTGCTLRRKSSPNWGRRQSLISNINYLDTSELDISCFDYNHFAKYPGLGGKMTEDMFSKALHQLYGAVSDSTLWPKALEALEDLMQSAGANINLVPLKAGEQGAILTGRLCPEGSAEYVRDYLAVCPRIAYATRHRPDVAYDAMIISAHEMDRDPVYDFFRKHGFRYFIGSALPGLGKYHASIGFQRTPQQGHVQTSDIATFKRIRPHLVQAITLANAFGSLQRDTQLSLSILDRLPQGFIIVGDDAKIMFTNVAADKILSSGNHLRNASGAITTCNLSERAKLAKLIADASGHGANGIADSGGWLRIDGLQSEFSLAVFAAPVTDGAQLSFVDRPAAIILVQKIGTQNRSTPDMLKALFGLTPTEARLASMLANGLSMQDAAEQLSRSAGTTRTHLKAIFHKMEVSRQQDLIAKVMKLAGAVSVCL